MATHLETKKELIEEFSKIIEMLPVASLKLLLHVATSIESKKDDAPKA